MQESEIDRVGGREPIQFDIRVIATTNRDIEKSVEDGQFREDLFFRLNVIPLTLPPLRERRIDGQSGLRLDDEAEGIIRSANWKGNVRELENVIGRAVLLCKFEMITIEDLMLKPATSKEAGSTAVSAKEIAKPGFTVAEMEKELIYRSLEAASGNRTKAADMLGVSIRTLRNKLNEHKSTAPKEQS